jgi:2-polyprenyl-6-methoxyphenol hydroxylase-like FAD-dependent oxidoreductase
MHRPRALVIGGSLGGLFAAHALRQVGWDATVFERTTEDLAGRGAGLGAREELFAVMRRIGISFDDTISIEVRSRVGLDRNGKICCEVALQSFATAWDRIYRSLRAALPAEQYRLGSKFERFTQEGDRITAIFADGSRETGDLLIGADGIHSTVRRHLSPQPEPSYAGYVGWRGVVMEHDMPPELVDLFCHHLVFGFPEGELMICVPMADLQGSVHRQRRAQFTWFRPVDYNNELPQLCTDVAGRCHGASIPPPLIRPELIRALRESAVDLLAPQLATLVARTKQPVLQAIYDMETPRLNFGRVILLGDAAFVARPHVGTGVTKAALDAQHLADVIMESNGNIDAALVRYDVDRRRFGTWLVERGRRMGAYLSAQLKPREQRSEIELHRDKLSSCASLAQAESSTANPSMLALTSLGRLS